MAQAPSAVPLKEEHSELVKQVPFRLVAVEPWHSPFGNRTIAKSDLAVLFSASATLTTRASTANTSRGTFRNLVIFRLMKTARQITFYDRLFTQALVTHTPTVLQVTCVTCINDLYIATIVIDDF